MDSSNASPETPVPPTVRAARISDCARIVEFNRLLARETEGKELDPGLVTRGVERALAEGGLLRYWVAESNAEVIAQAAASMEWSDWRCGWIWWFQSVYVDAGWRGRGVFRALHNHVRRMALADPDVIGLRLYVEQDNVAAQRTYAALGMTRGNYEVFEEFWFEPGTRGQKRGQE